MYIYNIHIYTYIVSLEEGTLAEDNSLQAQAYLVPDR